MIREQLDHKDFAFEAGCDEHGGFYVGIREGTLLKGNISIIRNLKREDAIAIANLILNAVHQVDVAHDRGNPDNWYPRRD